MKKYYTEKEKNLLVNFFITEGMNSKKDFKEYIEYFCTTHGNKVNDKYPNRRINGAWSELGNFEIEDVQYFWQNENNDNLVTYLYSQPKFEISSTKIKNIEKLKVDWNHITNNGENFLFYTRMYRLEETQKLIEKYNVATNLINNDGDIFFTHIFDKYYSKSKSLRDCELEMTRLEATMTLISDNNDLLQLVAKEKIEHIQKNFHDCVNSIENKLYEVAKRENRNQTYSYENDKLNGQLIYDEHRAFMDKIFNYHILNKKLVLDQNKDKVKKAKI